MIESTDRAPPPRNAPPPPTNRQKRARDSNQHRDRDRQRGFRGGWDRRDQAYVASRDADRVGKSRDSRRW